MNERIRLRDNLVAARARGNRGYVIDTAALLPILDGLSKRVPVGILGTVDPTGRFVDVTMTIAFCLDMNEETSTE